MQPLSRPRRPMTSIDRFLFAIDSTIVRWPILLTMTAAVAACGAAADTSPRAAVQIEARDLEALSRRAIYFGHQSVGGNLMDGAERLLTRAPGPAPRLVATQEPRAVEPGIWAHSLIGRNQDPFGKIAAFATALNGGLGARVDIAFFKLCYIDFDANTDATALFGAYRETLAELERSYPHTRFVHVTVPLTTVQTGVKAAVKRLLGRPVWGERENLRRHAYNELLRRSYPASSIFDLAALESTTPDGSPYFVEVDGMRVPALFPGFTYDGGHLEDGASERLAAELIRILARTD